MVHEKTRYGWQILVMLDYAGSAAIVVDVTTFRCSFWKSVRGSVRGKNNI
jgi:hypothetical protein